VGIAEKMFAPAARELKCGVCEREFVSENALRKDGTWAQQRPARLQYA
jgi:hypothetical protein